MVRVRSGNKLFGEVKLSGAKNAALPVVAAAALTGEGTVLHGVPAGLKDIQVLISLLKDMGITMRQENEDLYVDKVADKLCGDAGEAAGKIRSSLILLPVFLSLCKEASIPNPGGCNLGDRKFDILLDTLEKMGASVNETEERISTLAPNGFKGADLTFHIATTIGSENAVLAAAVSKGTTIVRNANTRPEVIDLIDFLNRGGAKISYKTRYMEIEGVDKLHACEYSVMQDRHEAVSYMILTAMLRGELCIRNFDLRHIQEDVDLLRRIGVTITEWGNDVYVSAKDRPLKPFSMVTYPYPGINSDMQPLFAALATTIEGESIITDTRFTERFQYVEEFKKLGADIVNYENCAIIQGGRRLKGAAVRALDLRAGAALTFLGTVAEGETTIDNFYQVERGYENIVSKMSGIGLEIKNDEN